MKADLHIHTTASDGKVSPAGIVKKAVAAGLDIIAITDHDTIDGLVEAEEEAKKHRLRIIPGVEFSTELHGREMHILGYYIDTDNPDLNNKLAELAVGREKRAREILAKLNDLGYSITYEEVRSFARGKIIGRLHFARALVEKKYVPDIGSAFSEDLLGEGGKAYVKHMKMTPAEAISLIHSSGGLAFLAHPGLLIDNRGVSDSEIAQLVEAGLDGVEIYHISNSPEYQVHYMRLVNKYGLLVSGGSDYHGDGEREGGDLGSVTVSDLLVVKMEERLKVRSKKN